MQLQISYSLCRFVHQVQPEMINIDTLALGKIDQKTLQQEMEEKKALLVTPLICKVYCMDQDR